MVKKVFKYGTGMELPKGAIYLNTQVELVKGRDFPSGEHVTIRLVWHYFLVDDDFQEKAE